MATAIFLIGTGCAAADAHQTMVVVALDRQFYGARELDVLEEQVDLAAKSRSDNIEITGSSAMDAVDVTIYDGNRDQDFVDRVQERFSNGSGESITRTAATTLRVSYAPKLL